MTQFQLSFPISYAVHPTLWIHLCRLHLFFSISTARSSHIFTRRKSSTLWPLCHNSGPYPLMCIGMLWRAQKDSEQEWVSVVFVFHVLGTNFLSLFTISLLGWLSACYSLQKSPQWGMLRCSFSQYKVWLQGTGTASLTRELERSYACRYMLCFYKFVQCKTSLSWFTSHALIWGQAEGNLSGPNLLSIALHNFFKLRNYFSNIKTWFSRQKFEGEQCIVFSYWTSLLWRNIPTYNPPLPGHWFRVSGKAGMLSHLITLVSYFLLHWLHERKNSCWNSEPSLCKLIHFHCYIWSNIGHLSKYAAVDFQITRCMYYHRSE